MNSIFNYKIHDDIKYGLEIEYGRSTDKLCKCGIHTRQHNFTDDCIMFAFHKDKIKNSADVGHHNNSWYFTNGVWSHGTDGSIFGYGHTGEIRSPILSGEKDLAQIHKVYIFLKELGCEVNESCGLHVHFDAQNFTLTDIKSIICFFKLYEQSINRLLPEHRHNNRYALSMGALDTISTLRSVKSWETLHNLYPTHYYRVCIQQIIEHKSIEFRQHQATLNFKRVMRWIKLLSACLELCKNEKFYDKKYDKLSYSSLSDLEEVLNYDVRIKIL